MSLKYVFCFTFMILCDIYRLLDVLLYITGIYLDEYTALKVILDLRVFRLCTSPNMTFQAFKDNSIYIYIYIPYCTVKYFIKV